MAIATVAVFNSPSPRADEGGGASLPVPTPEEARYAGRIAAASPSRVPPRVYTPFPARRLTRPMAVRAGTEAAAADSGRSRLPLFRGRRIAP